MIFIPYNVPSLKNGKVKASRGVFNSKTVRKYLQKIGVKSYSTRKKTVEDYVKRPNLFRQSVGNYFKGIEYPLVLRFHFVRDSRRAFDFNNANQLICDLLEAHGFIDGDDMKHLIPFPMQIDGRWYSVDPKNAGVYLQK